MSSPFFLVVAVMRHHLTARSVSWQDRFVVIELSQLTHDVRQGAHLTRHKSKEGEPFRVVSPRNVVGMWIEGKLETESLDPKKVEKMRLKPQWVLFSQFASHPKAAVVDEGDDEVIGAVAGSNLAIIVPNEKKIDSYYLAGMLSTRAIQERLIREAGGTASLTIPLQALRSLRLPVPPLDVQQQVGAAFSWASDTRRTCESLMKAQQERLEHVALDLLESAWGDAHAQ